MVYWVGKGDIIEVSTPNIKMIIFLVKITKI
jgi:hypothetical protein